jgi:hypothetical protein
MVISRLRSACECGALLVSLLAPAAACADIYVWTDERGSTVISDVPPANPELQAQIYTSPPRPAPAPAYGATYYTTPPAPAPAYDPSYTYYPGYYAPYSFVAPRPVVVRRAFVARPFVHRGFVHHRGRR